VQARDYVICVGTHFAQRIYITDVRTSAEGRGIKLCLQVEQMLKRPKNSVRHHNFLLVAQIPGDYYVKGGIFVVSQRRTNENKNTPTYVAGGLDRSDFKSLTFLYS